MISKRSSDICLVPEGAHFDCIWQLWVIHTDCLLSYLVCQHGTKDGEEVAESREGMVEFCRYVFREVKLLLEIQHENGFHAIIGKPFAEFIADDEEQRFGEG